MRRITAWLGVGTVVGIVILSAPARAAQREGDDRNPDRNEQRALADVVPRKILDYVDVRFPGAQISRVERARLRGRSVYVLRLKHDGREYRAALRPSGAMLQLEKTLSEPPPAIAQGIESRYPGARIKDLIEVDVVRGKTEKPHHFSATISLVDGRMTRVAVSPDGRRVREEPRQRFRVGGGGEGGESEDEAGGGMRALEGETDEREGGGDD